MHPSVVKLMELQKEDVEAKRLRDEMAALPKLVATLEAKAAATVGQRAVVIDLIAKEEALRRRQESDVRDKREKIAKVKKQLDLATSTVQVTAFEHEIQYLVGEIGKLEDAELESMERSEELEAQKAVADREVSATQQKAVEERARAISTIAKDKELLGDIEARRGVMRAGIDEDLLSLYDRLARSKGTALAETVNQKCAACQMLIRPQRWNDLRDRDNHDLFMCESCGRVLFYDPARDSPQKATVSVRQESIAAQIVRGG